MCKFSNIFNPRVFFRLLKHLYFHSEISTQINHHLTLLIPFRLHHDRHTFNLCRMVPVYINFCDIYTYMKIYSFEFFFKNIRSLFSTMYVILCELHWGMGRRRRGVGLGLMRCFIDEMKNWFNKKCSPLPLSP